MLSQTKFYQENKNIVSAIIIIGIMMGLISGFTLGLIQGIIFEIISMFVIIFMWQIAGAVKTGFIIGMIFMLTEGIMIILTNYSEALPFLTGTWEIIGLIAFIIIISEIMFIMMPKEKLNKNMNIFWHTAKRKFENIFEVLLGLSFIAQMYILARELKIRISISEVLKWIGYIGLGIVILGVVVFLFYIWIKLNSLKYKK